MDVRDLIPWGRSEARIPVRSTTVDPFFAVQREVNRIFDDLWRGFATPLGPAASTGWPAIEVYETDDEIRVTAELPGLREQDVELVLDDHALTLKGERRAENGGEADGFVFSERFFGRFHRVIPLAVAVDRERVEATMREGALTVVLPKSDPARQRSKRIPIGSR